jgi:hypothetical protein
MQRQSMALQRMGIRTPGYDQPFHGLSAPGERAAEGKENDRPQHDRTSAKDIRQIAREWYKSSGRERIAASYPSGGGRAGQIHND